MSLLLIVSCIIALCIALACAYDLVGPKQQKARTPLYRLRRLGNWFPLGLAYAAFYMARYNVSSGNTLAVRTKYAWTQQDIGGIISAGSWAYAISAPFTGLATDRLGGKIGFVLGCCGVAITNGLLGVVISLDNDQIHTSPRYILIVVLYSVNLFMQGFGTSAVSKINAEWYDQTERGVFSGIFNIVLSSGYFLALGTGASILDNLGYPYLFYIPSGICALMTLLVIAFVSNRPSDAKSVHITPVAPQNTSSVVQPPPTSPHSKINQTKALLHNSTFLGYLAAMFFLCWLRDGFLNWIYPFLSSVRSETLSSDDTAVLGGMWTLGGFVGGVLIGWISDTFFHSDRVQPIAIFSVFQAILLIIFYFIADTCSMAALATTVFITSVCTLGAYTLLGFTVPIDLPVDIAAGASGLMTCVGYIATGIANMFMGNTVEAYGYSVWIGSLVVASLLSGICTLVGSRYATPQAAPRIDRWPLKKVRVQRKYIAKH